MKRVICTDGKYGLTDAVPEYGRNYGKGYIGFCYDPTSFLSKSIAKATEHCNYSDIKVSHALIVVSENTCVEADAFSKKVIEAPLSKYFDDPNEVIFFRKPKDLNDVVADEIATLARSKIGCKYEYAEILGHLGKSLPGISRFNRITHNFFVDILSCVIDNKNKFICSELAAYSLKYAKSWEYGNKGILSRLTTRINPQELFEDKVIFKEWDMDNTG